MTELDLLSETVQRILESAPPGEDAAGWSPSAWRDLEEAGITRVGVAEESGGSGGGSTEIATVLYAAGRSPVAVPLAEAILGGWLLSVAGIPVPTGPLTAGRGGTAAPAGDGWTLDGEAPRVPWGRYADHAAILVSSEWGPVAALVDRRDCHVRPGENVAGEPRDTLGLSGVTLPAGRARALSPAVSGELLLRGAFGRLPLMAGAAGRALALSARYAGERTQFGRPIGRFQVVRQALAEIAAETAALHAAARAAIQAMNGHELCWTPLGAAKVRAGRAAGEVAAKAHQIHGALGCTWEHPLRRLTTRLWSWREEFGSESEWAAALGEWIVETGPGAFRLALADEDFSGGGNGPRI